jgi:hypothetical protein
VQQEISSQLETLPARKQDLKAFLIVGLAAILWLAAYKVIQPFASWLTYGLLGLSPASHLSSSLAFFFYDVLKIILLLGGMIFAITLLRSFFSAEKTRAWLDGKRNG